MHMPVVRSQTPMPAHSWRASWALSSREGYENQAGARGHSIKEQSPPVQPCLHAHWKGFSACQRFRGAW